MTLMEVVVAFALFLIMSTAALAGLTQAVALTREDRARLIAGDLATRELEITRDAFSSVLRGPETLTTNLTVNANPLPGGTAGKPLVSNGVPFTVKRTAQWAAVNSAAETTCDEGTRTELAYLRVKVEVTWPELGDRPPVVMETVMTPPKGTYSSLTGHIGLKVVDAFGQPVSGVTVTARAASGALETGVTSADGCALLAFLTPGAYSLTVAKTGYVTPAGDPTGATTAQVLAGQLWRGSVSYDQEATMVAKLVTEAGFALPQGLAQVPLALANSGLLPGGKKFISGTGATRTLEHLWPYPSGYEVWAGKCLDNDPQYTGQERDEPVAVGPGATTHTEVRLAPVIVRAAGPVTATLTAPVEPSRDRDCATTPLPQVSLGVATGGELRTSLPYGVWKLTATNGRTGEVMLRQGAPAPGQVNLS